MLTLKNISFSYNQNKLLRNINLSIVPGAFILIKGKNGSGKTTLLKIIAGIINPSFGSIAWNNVDIHEDIDTYHSHVVSYLGIQNALKHSLTIFENLSFWANISGNKELVSMAINYFKLDEIANIKCSKLSSGLLKRVALARMIIENNDLWLMDEPDVYLDDDTKECLKKLIEVKTREGGIVIVSTHSLIPNFPETSIINLDFKNN